MTKTQAVDIHGRSYQRRTQLCHGSDGTGRRDVTSNRTNVNGMDFEPLTSLLGIYAAR